MKKIKYLLLIILSFLFFVEVKALTNNSLLYEVYWEKSGVNVFAQDTTYNSMDYNGWFIKSNNDNYIYYCIEPELYMQNSEEAISNTHTIYEGDKNIIANSKLNNITLERVKLLAYYGYGYKDNKVNHTSKSWYGITQVMIWKVLRPEIKYVFKDSRYGIANKNLFLKEAKEINDLVDNHYKSPSMHNLTITMKKGESITLEDTNNVLSNYFIQNTSFADFEIKDNKLTINAKEEINTNVVLKKPQVSNKVMLFKGKSLQDLFTRGNVSTPEFNFNLVIEGKDIRIKKIDKETGIYNEKLKGSIFGLYDKDNNLVKEIEITKETETINLSYGKYYLKEIKASEEYSLNEKTYEFEVNESSNNFELIIENELIRGNLEFLKIDYSSKKPLPGVLIEVYTENDTLIYSGRTNELGKVSLNNLVYGKYYIIETETIKYYRLSKEKIEFEIKENKVTVERIMTNNRKEGNLEFLKIDKDSEKPLKDAFIEIYFSETKEMIFSGRTDEFGKIVLNNIIAGNYYIIEKEAPYGYLINKDKLYFELVEEQEIVKIEMTNEKIEVPNTFSENKILLYLIFSILITITLVLKQKHENNF